MARVGKDDVPGRAIWPASPNMTLVAVDGWVSAVGWISDSSLDDVGSA